MPSAEKPVRKPASRMGEKKRKRERDSSILEATRMERKFLMSHTCRADFCRGFDK